MSNTESYDDLVDAAVNEDNGDIAFSYFDSDRGFYVVKNVDADGKTLFSQGININRGMVYVQYIDSQLFIYISTTNWDQLQIYDRDGTLLQTVHDDLISDFIDIEKKRDTWSGWKEESRKKSFTLEYLEYIYRTSPFYKDIIGKGERTLLIRDQEGNEKTIYHSGA